MTDTALLAIVIAGSAAVIAWSIWQARGPWQQTLWREIRRDLERHDTATFQHCARLQRRLDRHHRILKYLARRLS
jgi:hypothetical protein